MLTVADDAAATICAGRNENSELSNPKPSAVPSLPAVVVRVWVVLMVLQLL